MLVAQTNTHGDDECIKQRKSKEVAPINSSVTDPLTIDATVGNTRYMDHENNHYRRVFFEGVLVLVHSGVGQLH